MGNSSTTEESKDFLDRQGHGSPNDDEEHCRYVETKPSSSSKGNMENSCATKHHHEDYDYLLKPILIGDSGCGKTICIHQITRSPIAMNVSTIGIDYQFKYYTEVMMRGKQVKLKMQYQDSAGQLRFRELTYGYYASTHIFILMYDVTNVATFESIPIWLKSIHDRNNDAQIILVGNKIDLIEKRVVTTEQGLKLAAENEIDFVEVSSMHGTNFNILEKLILENAITFIEKKEFQESDKSPKQRIQSSSSFTPLTSRKRQLIQRTDEKKLQVSIQVTEKGLTKHETFFPKTFPIDDSTVFKIMENYHVIIIDNIRENFSLEIYFINETNLNTFLIECKQVYSKVNFKNYEYRLLDASLIYKKVCQQLKNRPEPNIAHLFESIDHTHTTCNLRGVLFNESSLQRCAIFRSIIWIYSLRTIDLGYNNLNDTDIKELCDAIHQMNNISELYLNGNTSITQTGYLHLVNIMMDNTGLKKLVLSGCNVTSNSAIPLISCIPSSSLEVLDFSACALDSDFTNKLTQLYFARKQRLQKYKLKELKLFLNEGLDIDCFLKFKDSFADLKIDILQYYKPKLPKELESKSTENTDILIKGRYRIDKFIKKGGFGKVYLCTDTYDQTMSKQVAVKMVTFYDISELEGHIKEISHQNFIKNEELIAPLLSIEMSAQENKLYLIMPYFKLGDLGGIIYERFIKRQPFPESMIVRFAKKASKALCYLIDNNIVHRDVKPSNFLTCKYSDNNELECVLSDFGLATSISNSQMPIDDTSCTSKYAPPELFESGNSTFKGDVFSLGCTLYEMMSLDSNTIIWHLFKNEGELSAKNMLTDRIEKNTKEYSQELIQLLFSMIDPNPFNRPDYRSIMESLELIG